MYAISFLQGMVFYGPIAILYREALGVSIFQITIIESISLALCLLLELPWGIIADKIGYRKTLILCNVMYFLSKIVFWKADGFGMFLLERVMLSVVISGLSGVDMSVLYLSSGEEDSQKVFGVYESLGTAGLLAASFVYTVLAGEDYRLFGFLTMISYGAAMLLSLFLTEVRPEEEETGSVREFTAILRNVSKNPAMLCFLLAVVCLNESHQLITVFLSQLKYVSLSMGSSMMGILYIVLTVIGLFGACSVTVREKLGIGGTAAVCFGAAAVSGCLLAVTDSIFVTVFALFLIRAAFTVFGPFQMELQNRMVKTRQRATELSVNAIIIDGAAVFFNVIFGKLADWNLSFSFGFGGVLCLVGAVLFLLWIKFEKTCSKVEKKSC